MERRGRWALWAFAGLLLGVILAAAVVSAFARTDAGRERILALTVRSIGGQLGEGSSLTIDRLEGNLLTGAKLYNLTLRGPDAKQLLQVDSAFVDYDVRTLLGNDLVLDRLIAFGAEVFVQRLPGDTLWNYERIFPGNPQDTARGRVTIIKQARIVRTFALVQLPWEPDSTLTGADRDSVIAEALTDSSDVLVERVPGGFLRSYRVWILDADVARLVNGRGDRIGTYARIRDLSGNAQIFREPVRIFGLQGEFGFRDGQLNFRADTARLPNSVLSAAGVVDVGDTLRYDVVFRSRQLALRDLQWLYAPIPRDGDVAGVLAIETRPAGLFFQVDSLRLRAPGTRIRGSFGLRTGDTIRFVDPDLVADPLRVRTVESMLPTELPVRGLRIGAAEIRTPDPR